MSSPSVSILIPAYNGEKFLSACLDSVLAQTYQDWELVIVDDCSNDSTPDIVEAYALRDSRVRGFRNPANLGLVGNWNRCVELARGKWIKFVFQDDLIAPSCIEEMLDAAGDRTSLVACRRDFLFEEGTDDVNRDFYTGHPSVTALAGMSEVAPETVCVKAIDLLGVNFIGEPSAVLLRTDVFERYGKFNPDLIMICDTEYWLRVATETGLVYLPTVLCHFRVHRDSVSARNLASRRYRIGLDAILLLSEFAFNEGYAKLRAVAASRVPPVNLIDLLRVKASKAMSIAHEGGNASPDAMAEWTAFLRAHPRIREVLGEKTESEGPGFLYRLGHAVGRAAHKVTR